jgi:nucleoside-diphosphate-sugar epimerase
MKKNRKYLFITGATGFLGENFLIKAKKKGYKIFALSRKKKKNNSKNVIWLKGELDENFDDQLKQTDILIHFAAAGVNKKSISIRESLKENVYKPHQLLLNCLKNGCKKWIIIGSASEYGKSAEKKLKLQTNTIARPQTNYEKSKYLFSKLALSLSKKNEAMCRVMRIFNVYGEGENKKKLLSSLNSASKKKIQFIINSSYQLKDFIEIGKVTDTLIDAIDFRKKSKKFPQIWHVASGIPMTVKEFVISKVGKNKKLKLKFKSRNKIVRNFITEKKSIWKI